MPNFKDLKKQAKGKLNAAKSFNEKLKDFDKDVLKKFDEDSKDWLEKQGKKAQAFADKAKKKIPNTKNLFDNLVSDLEKMIGIEAISGETKLRRITRESVNETVGSTKQIVIDNVKSILFSNDNDFGCGVSTPMPFDTITIKPNEFDFLGTLKMDPTTPMGLMVYEDQNLRNKTKMNKELYQTFDSVTPYTFTSNSGNDLFTMTWNSANQEWDLSGLQGSSNNFTIDTFISQYYETIEFPVPSDILKQTMTLMAGSISTNISSETKEFDQNTNLLNRLLARVMSACGPQKKDEFQQNATDQFEEDEVADEFYFDFDDVDGIDLDDEDLRYKKVMRFRDCNNFEVPIDRNHMEDFAYLSKKDPLSAFNSTLNKISRDAYEQSSTSPGQNSIPFKNFSLSINMAAVKNLPKALLGSVFSAKIFLPLVVMWKMLKAKAENLLLNAPQLITSARELVKNFGRLLYGILRDLFMKFINIFWKKAKPILVAIIAELIPRIFKNSKKRYVKILKNLLKLAALAAPFLDIKNCSDLYQQILKLLDLLKIGAKQRINGFILQFAKARVGFDCDRATIAASEKLEANGIETGDLFGESNNVVSFVQSILCGNQEEMDENSFVQISLDPTTIPVAPGGGAALLSPLVRGTGILT